jgi:hypothetical protein
MYPEHLSVPGAPDCTWCTCLYLEHLSVPGAPVCTVPRAPVSTWSTCLYLGAPVRIWSTCLYIEHLSVPGAPVCPLLEECEGELCLDLPGQEGVQARQPHTVGHAQKARVAHVHPLVVHQVLQHHGDSQHPSERGDIYSLLTPE